MTECVARRQFKSVVLPHDRNGAAIAGGDGCRSDDIGYGGDVIPIDSMADAQDERVP
ncbi:MAG: hypothetical protein ACRD3W_25780 [Terriglobales bacterium]